MRTNGWLLVVCGACAAGCVTVLPVRAVILEDDAYRIERTCQEVERVIKGNLVTVQVCKVTRVPTGAPSTNPMTPAAVSGVVGAANGVWSRNGLNLEFDPADYVVEHSTRLNRVPTTQAEWNTYGVLGNAMAQLANPAGDRIVVLFRGGGGQGWSWGPGASNYVSMPGLYNYFLDHELGHYLGLVHTFSNGTCSRASLQNSDNDPGGMLPVADDDVNDTPADPSAWCLLTVNAVLTSGTTMLAATNGGIFSSTSGGVTWSRSATRLAGLQVRGLVQQGTTYLAGTSGGIYASSDAGATWTLSSTGLGTQDVGALAASATRLFAGVAGGLYRSADGGATWTAAGALANKDVDAVAAGGGRVYAGTHGDGVFVSLDDGATWTPASSGLTSQTVRSLAVDGADVLAGTDGGLFRSSNGGSSWRAITPPALAAAPDPTVLSVVASGALILAGSNAGLYQTANGGTDWVTVNVAGVLERDAQVSSLSRNGTALLAGTVSRGIPHSPDDGATWLQPTAGPAIDFCADDPFTVNHVTFHVPPLRNVMSYNGCQPAELTPDQVHAVRYNLAHGRSGIPIYRRSP